MAAVSLIQSRFGFRGNFEVVAPLVGEGLIHWWRNNDDPNFPWASTTDFSSDVGHVTAVSLIHGNFGNLEAVAVDTTGALWHFWRDGGGNWHHDPESFGFGPVMGQPSGVALIQSSIGGRSNFEVVAPRELGLGHWFRDNADPNLPWTFTTSFGAELGVFGSVSLIQSNFRSPGNLEVAAVATDGYGTLWHFWREDDGVWHSDPRYVSGESGPVSLIQGNLGGRGNFELLSGGDGGNGHLFRNNDDPNYPWRQTGNVAIDLGQFSAVSLIQSNLAFPGPLEAVAIIGPMDLSNAGQVWHFWSEDNVWNRDAIAFDTLG
jgi:hypothetical protein